MKQRAKRMKLSGGMAKRPVASAVAVMIIVLVVLILVPRRSISAPGWWTTQGVVNTNATADYAPASLGQLKNFAHKAYDEFQANLQNGAGSGLSNLVFGFATSNNYGPVALGQLKNVAYQFYDRMAAVGYTNTYPWTTNTQADDTDFAPANVGQLKSAFNFTLDADEDGMPDWWENLYGLNPTNSVDGSQDTDGDGYSNLQEYQHNTNPNQSNPIPTIVITYPKDGGTLP